MPRTAAAHSPEPVRGTSPASLTLSDFPAAANTIRILVATDNHVGYAERDPVRGNDSFTTFNEIMELAKEQDVPPPHKKKPANVDRWTWYS
jgi:hypothetical protein